MPENSDPYGDEYAHHVKLRSEGELIAALPSVIRYSNDYSTAWLISERIGNSNGHFWSVQFA